MSVSIGSALIWMAFQRRGSGVRSVPLLRNLNGWFNDVEFSASGC